MASELVREKASAKSSGLSMQISSAFRKQKCKQVSSTCSMRVISRSGIMPTKRDIPERLFTRHTPLNVTYGIGIDEHDHEGRVITLEMDDFFLVTVYVPNAQDELKRLDYRMRWEDDFLAYIKSLDAKKPVIVCGDLNVAHQEIDLKNPKTNRRNPGFTDEERGKFTTWLESGFTDTFRHLFPEQVTYSWWSYRFRAREKNIGWRIDYFVTSKRIDDRIADAKIHTEIMGSDHCPVELVLQ